MTATTTTNESRKNPPFDGTHRINHWNLGLGAVLHPLASPTAHFRADRGNGQPWQDLRQVLVVAWESNVLAGCWKNLAKVTQVRQQQQQRRQQGTTTATTTHHSRWQIRLCRLVPVFFVHGIVLHPNGFYCRVHVNRVGLVWP